MDGLAPLGVRRAHLVGIGGAGMNALAHVLVESGLKVTGSDLRDSEVVEAMRKVGIDVKIGHSASNVDADIVIISSAVASDNAEVLAARSKGITVLSRAEAVTKVLAERQTIAVTGTHGKTTVSGMIVSILKAAGEDPTYLVGADMAGGAPGGSLGSGRLAVVEADEAFGSFLHLEPFVGVVLNIEDDHLDYYGTSDELRKAFATFMDRSKTLIVCGDDQEAVDVAGGRKYSTFGIGKGMNVIAEKIVRTTSGTEFQLVVDSVDSGSISIDIPGIHKVTNSLAAAAACVAVGIDRAAIVEGLCRFRGMARRFERRESFMGADVVDDYAHMPAEVEATIAAARQGEWERVIAIFQPHLYSRTKMFAKEFGKALSEADIVVVTDVYPAREEPLQGITGKVIADSALQCTPHKKVAYLPSFDDVPAFLRGVVRKGDLILSMGAGDIGELPDLLLSTDQTT